MPRRTPRQSKRIWEGKDVYEVSLTGADQNNIDVMVSPEGALLLIEQQISRKELPAGIAKTLETKYPKARYRIVEKVLTVTEKEEKLTGYEVILFTPKKEMWAVEFAVDGKIVKEEKAGSRSGRLRRPPPGRKNRAPSVEGALVICTPSMGTD